MQKSIYKSLSDWARYEGVAYKKAVKLQLIDEICETFGWENKHLERNPRGYWTLERCKEIAIKYKTKKEWRENSDASYSAAHKKGWIDQCCEHMIFDRNPHGYWTKERCIERASKYENKKLWEENDLKSYGAAYRGGWVDECTQHMTLTTKPHGYWTRETCREESLKYKTKNDWQENSSTSYNVSRKNGWLKEFSSHMISGNKLRYENLWTKETCIEEAKKHVIIKSWQKKSYSSFKFARRNGWLDECTAHMKKKFLWTLELCVIEAKNYRSRVEWKKNSVGSFNAAYRNKWISECTKHMK